MLLLKEIGDKLVRLQRYVQEAEIHIPDRRSDLLRYLNLITSQRLKDLENSWGIALQLRARYGIEQATTTLIRVMAPLEEFKALHKSLRWFYTPWAEADTDSFLQGLFQPPATRTKYRELGVTVGFSDEYDFLHPYPHIYSVRKRPGTPAFVALPRIEKNNPLMWCALAHEVGHAVVEASDACSPIVEHMKKTASDQEMKFISAWARELSADLFALYLLGPAYVLAYQTFYQFLYHDRSGLTAFQEDTLRTPSPARRIDFLRQQLHLMDQRFLPPSGRGVSEPLTHYLQLFDLRLQLEKQRRGYDTPDPQYAELFGLNVNESMYENLIRQIKREVDKGFAAMGLKAYTYDHNFWCSAKLATRLKENELISSWREYAKVEDEVSKIQVDSENLQETCRKLNEMPCLASEIVNAGWVCRITEDHNAFVVQGGRPLPTFMEELEESEYRTRLLQKSIETAAVHSTFKDRAEMYANLGTERV